jgi:hypothetical protein
MNKVIGFFAILLFLMLFGLLIGVILNGNPNFMAWTDDARRSMAAWFVVAFLIALKVFDEKEK